MPEGHTIHRLARDLKRGFAGQVVAASSPQGRFVESAALVDGTVLERTDAYGKHLFIGFAGARWVHVHLGLIGGFTLGVGDPPAPRGAIRLRLAGDDVWADLRGPAICELVDRAEKAVVVARLGADPLRRDADPDRAYARLSRSRLPVGALMMDQSVVAGVGNVFRAEVLFRANLDPFRPGREVAPTTWQQVWDDLVALMRLGVRRNRIDTVRPEHTPRAMRRPKRQDDHGGEVYVYRRNDQPCHVCGTTVRTEVMAGRNLFWCPTCQAPDAERYFRPAPGGSTDVTQ